MTKQVKVTDAPDALREVLRTICVDGVPVALQENGRTVGVLIAPEIWEDYQRLALERLGSALDRVPDLNLDPEQLERIITEEVEAVRRERYERRRG